MMEVRNARILRTIAVLIAVCLVGFPAYAQYGGGTGEPNDPYQIATAYDLMLLGDNPEDYDKHFILTADIDLNPNLPGRKVFDRAVIAPDMNDIEEGIQGTFFTGTFDGKDHTISHLTIKGDSFLGLFGSLFGKGITGAIISNLRLEAVDVNGAGDYIGGLVGYFSGSIFTTYSTGTVNGEECVGGLVGKSTGTLDDGKMSYSSIESCYSSVDVSGVDCVGGLVGTNLYGTITNCYATGSVVASPINWWLPGGVGSGLAGGGLVGENWHTISYCYATGSVVASGTTWTPGVGGGLVGENNGEVMYSFWDTQTSGQTVSGGGTPKTTAEMQTASTFLEAGWDFVDETENGTEDIWDICEGTNYPRFVWQIPVGDFVCPDGVSILDFSVFAAHWLDDNCDISNDYCDGTDLDLSGAVNINDLEAFADNWLDGTEP